MTDYYKYGTAAEVEGIRRKTMMQLAEMEQDRISRKFQTIASLFGIGKSLWDMTSSNYNLNKEADKYALEVGLVPETSSKWEGFNKYFGSRKYIDPKDWDSEKTYSRENVIARGKHAEWQKDYGEGF